MISRARVYTILSICILLYCLYKWCYNIIIYSINNEAYHNLLFLVFTPYVLFILIFVISFSINLAINPFIPLKYVLKDSKYLSVNPPPIVDIPFINMTTIIPVYTENFDKIIKHTIENRIKTNEEYSGFTNIIICDDGLMKLPEEQEKRIRHYKNNNINYVGRLLENRLGNFKKASNLDFTMNIIVDCIDPIEKANTEGFMIGISSENNIINNTNKLVIYDYVTLLDADTKEPNKGSLERFCREVARSDPSVAIWQYRTNAIQIQNDYFENSQANFIDSINDINFLYSTSSGLQSMFGGHNAVLKWSAIKRNWSYEHVSEDLEINMRIQCDGFTTKYIYYDTYGEGVDLMPSERINRDQKYARGVFDLTINPIKKWREKGVFNSNIKDYLFSKNISFDDKYETLGYFGSYYVLALNFPLYYCNFLLYNYSNYWRYITITPTSLFIGIILTYIAGISLYYTVIKYKFQCTTENTSKQWFIIILIIQLKYTTITYIYYSGLSSHICYTFCCYFFDINMSWGTTIKEIDNSTWLDHFLALKQYKFMYILVFISLVILWVLWWLNIISELQAVFPILYNLISHALMPIILNYKLTRIK